jgi:hypothetical protein
MSDTQTHRQAITDGLDPKLTMYRFRSDPPLMVQYAGLWGAWWGGETLTVPAGIKVVLATVVASGPAENAPLGVLPWTILQCHSFGPDDPQWAALLDTLRPEIEARANENRADRRCPGRLVFDPSQDVHSTRRIQKPDDLQQYTIERVEVGTGNASAPRPVSVLQRERIEYGVFRGRSDDLRPQPVTVFLERLVPKRQQAGQRLNSESGFARTSSLLSAVEEWRTWVVLT